jgi:hypothetical protein
MTPAEKTNCNNYLAKPSSGAYTYSNRKHSNDIDCMQKATLARHIRVAEGSGVDAGPIYDMHSPKKFIERIMSEAEEQTLPFK